MPDTFGSSEVSVAWILGAPVLPSHLRANSAALLWEGRALTYGQLRERALRMSAGLREQGLSPGDRVAAYMFNRGEMFELYFACAYAGVSLVPINFRFVAEELASVLSDCTPKLLVASPRLLDRVNEAHQYLQGAPRVVVLDEDESGAEYESLVAAEPLKGPYHRVDPHLLLYTSGTTGRPKAAMMSHMNIMWAALQSAAFEPRVDRRVTLLSGPLYNTAAINEMSIPTFLLGGTVGIMPSGNWNAEKMASLIDQWSVTHTTVYPSMMEPFLDADSRSPLTLASLRYVLTGGEVCPPDRIRKFRSRWQHLSVTDGYGMTESSSIASVSDEEFDSHPGAVGRPTGSHTLKVVNSEGGVAAVGEVGEILSASPAVVSGYWNSSEVSSASLEGGWHRSGDLGWIDSDGFLHIAGRVKEVVISGAQNVYPAEVERVLRSMPEVGDVAVFGVPDAKWGESVTAAVELKAGATLTEAEVVSFAREHLASYKKPQQVVFVERLPRNASQKVEKAVLREWVLSEEKAPVREADT